MKKLLYLLLIVFVIGLAIYGWNYKEQKEYEKKYYITNEKSSIQYNLKLWLNRDGSMTLDPKVFEVEKIADTSSYIVLFELEDNQLGVAQLVEGKNNKLRIKEAGYGGFSQYRYEDLKTNKGRYFFVMGENPELQIDHIEVLVDYTKSYSYLIDVSKDEFFFHYKKIPEDLDQRTQILYFDKNNKQFTDDELRILFAEQ
ncbi:hypothetical protein [Fredinandcohnia sp. 179-A 10B2 NHS]|uniref:hypothetical protein n=1 Tax=Fredinandcohnia sp. 179-A 10B2 NHS TaxID=3235176 RepID=UPI0039A1B7FB